MRGSASSDRSASSGAQRRARERGRGGTDAGGERGADRGPRGRGGADEASYGVTLAFKPGLPTGHNMVGVTTEGTTTWSHLVVQA